MNAAKTYAAIQQMVRATRGIETGVQWRVIHGHVMALPVDEETALTDYHLALRELRSLRQRDLTQAA